MPPNKRIRITRLAQLPDPVRLNRYAKAPELGPRILFFSGGTALNDTCRILKNHTHNSVHLVTPFDSGGSSAKLRRAFAMPSIGDLRSRLTALADENITGQPEVYRLFTFRFPARGKPGKLVARLDDMVAGRDPLVHAVSSPMRRLIRNQLGYFREAMPVDFDLRGASAGNLILAGGYLNNHKHLDPIIFLFSKLVGVLGTVRAVVNDDLHLGAVLEDGSEVLGQHRLTGKEVAPLSSPVRQLFLSTNQESRQPARSELRKKNRKLIGQADLICFPPGSFYTSVVANLLPQGVSQAIAASASPKIYIPNLGKDPEQVGMSLEGTVHTLLGYLRAGLPDDVPATRLLNFVLIDRRHGGGLPCASLRSVRRLGIEIIDTRLVSRRSAPGYDPCLLAAALLSLT